MCAWEQKSLASSLPGGIEQIVNSVNSISESIVPIANEFKTVVEIGQNFLNSVPNMGYMALMTIANEIKTEIEKLKQFSLTWLVLHPFIDGIGSYNKNIGMYTLSPGKMLKHLAKKLDDANDSSCPGGSSGGFVGMVAVSDFNDFKNTIYSINSFMQFKELDAMKRTMDEVVAIKNGYQAPMEPRFKTKSIATTLPLYNAVFENMEGLANNVLSVANGASAATELLIKKLEAKIEKLTDIANTIKNLENAIESATKTNVSWLYVTPQENGIEILKEALLSSENQPSNDLDFSFSFTGLGSGADLEMFASVFGLG